ncbi:MAG: BatA domain-containing protein [Planctomycetaceae bacterium]
MVWLHPYLLFGLLAVAAPVILHLLMRAKPKKLVFPALRLIQNRRRTNVRRLRLRHWALMLLRMAVIALVVLAVARPSLPAADYSLSSADWLRLGLVAAGAATLYFGLMTWWRRRSLAAHELVYRRALLRAGVGALAVLALLLLVAWPYQRRIAAAVTQPTLAVSEYLPVAAVMLFDTSLSMQYRHESRTRLEMAQDIAARHIAALPRLSRVAVCDTASDTPIRMQADLSGVLKRIGALTVAPLNRPLDDRLLAAVDAQIEDHERQSPGDRRTPSAPGLQREIYVFTDLTTAAWRRDELPRLKEVLSQQPALGVYLIDVGVPSPTNVAIAGLTLSEQTAPRGADVRLRAVLEGVGIEPGERVVELFAETESPRMVKLSQQPVQVNSGSATTMQFSLPLRASTANVVQGELRLLSSDPLPFDDVRPFTVRVRPPVGVLVAAETAGDALFVTNALAALGSTRYRYDFANAAQLSDISFSKYSVVWLLNVGDPGAPAWRALADFVEKGGTAMVVLGDRVIHEGYLARAALDLLPGKLQGRTHFDPPQYLDLQNVMHPLLKKFADWGGTGGLTSVPIAECWTAAPAERDAAVIAPYTDERPRPALMERAVGDGRALLLTTSLDRRWNDLPVTEWFIVLVDQLLQYASQSLGATYNFILGEPVRLPLPRDEKPGSYLLQKPNMQQLRQEIPSGARSIAVSDIDQLGNYRITGTEPASKIDLGFSVTADPAESSLTRLSKDDLDAHLGADRASVARDIENLRRNVQAGRVGREAFPVAALLLLAAFLAEHFLANRFYDDQPQPEPA